ncbi:MAG: hypothetical protein ONB07_02840 [candidate division KSB1 bacterium]|nr:hypothetical protein [candidate division KSB1 bacterium]MDZ7414190.1 hypothetical protein [candidate division KSB1 bacterium]
MVSRRAKAVACRGSVLLLALVSTFAATGCYTKLWHRPVEVEGAVASTYRVGYGDDCSSCHSHNPMHEQAFGPAFYHDPGLYAWQWYYQVPWWMDVPVVSGQEGGVSGQAEARDFSRRHVAPLEQPYTPTTVGGQSGMAPPMGKVGTESTTPATVPPAPEPRRDFARREFGEQSGERQREAKTDPAKESAPAKVKKQE